MNNLNNLTVIIVTYKTSEKVLIDCLNSIQKNVKVLIIENSKNFPYEDKITLKFPNTKIYCTGENLGYGKGNNYGIKKSSDDYVLILNPDVICDKDFFNNISKVIEEADNFSIIGCQYLHDKVFMPAGFFDKHKNKLFKKNFKENNINPLSEVEWVTGCSMLLNLKKFQNKQIFDENFFLYFEEVDLCKSLINRGEKIYTSKKLKIDHLGFKSSQNITLDQKKDINILREWHWMWSSFYFYKKNYNYLYAFRQMFGKFIKSFIKTIFYFITFQKDKKDKYLFRFLGIFNAMIGKKSFFRIKDKKD
tara:strand:- start:334 stop:1248 length:915 start_codon:yes stop_codon:yes gene_type:complete